MFGLEAKHTTGMSWYDMVSSYAFAIDTIHCLICVLYLTKAPWQGNTFHITKPFVMRIHQPPLEYQYKGKVILGIKACFVISTTKMMNKQLQWKCFDMSLHPYDVTCNDTCNYGIYVTVFY